MEFEDVSIQYFRLLRHYKLALSQRDPISFLDLSHSLRIWVDMKTEIDELILRTKLPIRFTNPLKSRKVDKILRGTKYSFLPLASGVENPGIQIKGVRKIYRALNPDEVKALYEAGPTTSQTTTLNFSEWVGSSIYKVPDAGDDCHGLQISREILIRRVANILGASHPKGTDNEDALENRFDKYIIELHSLSLSEGFPATYYQLLEIAKDILNSLKTVFMVPE